MLRSKIEFSKRSLFCVFSLALWTISANGQIPYLSAQPRWDLRADMGIFGNHVFVSFRDGVANLFFPWDLETSAGPKLLVQTGLFMWRPSHTKIAAEILIRSDVSQFEKPPKILLLLTLEARRVFDNSHQGLLDIHLKETLTPELEIPIAKNLQILKQTIAI